MPRASRTITLPADRVASVLATANPGNVDLFVRVYCRWTNTFPPGGTYNDRPCTSLQVTMFRTTPQQALSRSNRLQRRGEIYVGL
jgi:hypothetical protein